MSRDERQRHRSGRRAASKPRSCRARCPTAPAQPSAGHGERRRHRHIRRRRTTAGSAITGYTANVFVVRTAARPARRRARARPDRRARLDGRQDLHVLGDGDERGRCGPGVGGVGRRRARRRLPARRPSGRRPRRQWHGDASRSRRRRTTAEPRSRATPPRVRRRTAASRRSKSGADEPDSRRHVDERQDVHVHGQGDERQRDRPGLGRVERGRARATVPGAPTIGTAAGGNASMQRYVHRTGEQRRERDHELHRHVRVVERRRRRLERRARPPIAVGSLTNTKTYTCSVTATNAIGPVRRRRHRPRSPWRPFRSSDARPPAMRTAHALRSPT